MSNEDIEYIQPNQIGNLELSEEEKIIINKTEKKYIKDIYGLIIAAIVLIIGILMAKFEINTQSEIGETAITFIVTPIIWIASILFLKRNIKYTAAARGIIVRKDAITQKVVANRKYTYRRYFAEPPHTDKPTVEQEFYYLTVKLMDGRYVRYVNCLKEDFDALFNGDIILVVCYGFNEIKGYIV